jgi:ABC-type multidrug transport system ATPase subunit
LTALWLQIDALLEDLGLSQVRHTRVADLTCSERQRLNVACHLLLDTDIVVLDQPTRGMDIFDTFFLVEYLRQWAGRGRIVVVTLHPPTYEILTMVSKVVLLSTGRLMYYGKRREMLPYFAFIEYPCPAYKNPSDYYRKSSASHSILKTLYTNEPVQKKFIHNFNIPVCLNRLLSNRCNSHFLWLPCNTYYVKMVCSWFVFYFNELPELMH